MSVSCVWNGALFSSDGSVVAEHPREGANMLIPWWKWFLNMYRVNGHEVMRIDSAPFDITVWMKDRRRRIEVHSNVTTSVMFVAPRLFFIADSRSWSVKKLVKAVAVMEKLSDLIQNIDFEFSLSFGSDGCVLEDQHTFRLDTMELLLGVHYDTILRRKVEDLSVINELAAEMQKEAS